jgi:arabinan endo-1,5-alpha-L-arabinosidase
MFDVRGARRRALVRTVLTAVLAATAVTAVPSAPALATGGGAVAGTGASSAPAPVRPEDPIAHDPTMVKEGDYYYVVITGDIATHTYLPMKRSKDLRHWEELGPVFRSLPAWVSEELGTTPGDAWAPELNYVDGHWALYYAASQFGTQNSVIGLATTRSLDPASPDHGWKDEGLVLRSRPGVDDFNAIDPDYSTDTAGRAWLSFGSFWGGIRMRRVDRATGKLSATDQTLHALASRPDPGAEEGPSIVRHGRYYYLFLSFDFCCRGVESDYRVVVGRSRSITGPYVDRSGVPLRQGGGTEVLRGYNEFVGTGGGDVYAARGRTYYVNHYYDATDGGTPRLNVRPVSWSGGWPRLGEPVNPSRSVGHGDAYVRLVERNSGLPVVDVGCGYEGANIALGENRRADPCQQWQLGHRSDGTSRLLNRFSNKVAEVAACRNVDGGDVAQWGWLGFLPSNDCQRWTPVPTRDGWTTVRSALPGGRVLDAAGCGRTAGTDVVVHTRAADRCQELRFEPVGRVLLQPANRERQALALGLRRREWRFHPAGGATYTITDTVTGRRLAPRGCRPRGHGACAKWTIVPQADGTWDLANVGTRAHRAVRLLRP